MIDGVQVLFQHLRGVAGAARRHAEAEVQVTEARIHGTVGRQGGSDRKPHAAQAQGQCALFDHLGQATGEAPAPELRMHRQPAEVQVVSTVAVQHAAHQALARCPRLPDSTSAKPYFLPLASWAKQRP